MQGMTFRRALRPLLAAALVASVALIPTVGASAAHTRAAPIYLTTAQNFRTTMTRNFNPYDCAPTTAMDFTCAGIYEPLMIITPAGGGHTYPWLATGYKWADGNKTLDVMLRHGVQWSDGQPFTANDVAFTFNYGKKYSVADQNGLWASKTLQSVNVVNQYEVAFHFTTVDTTILPNIVSNIKIVPQHIWSKITNPQTYTNPNPVGTGPFTQIARFTGQEYILGKNPHYWQPGKPAYDGIRVPAFTGNDSANLAMVNGELDWTGNFVPDVQKVYVSKDPTHFHYFYADDSPANGLFFNDQVYPYSMVAFRKALSHAIDRNKIWLIGEYGYDHPAGGVGIEAAWPTWVDQNLEPQAKAMLTYDPSLAKSMLAKAGFTWKNGALTDPRGHKVSMELDVIGGWTDWVLDMQIMQKEFQAIGIDATIKTMDQNSWTDKADKGLLNTTLHWTNGGVTPYSYFYGFMSKESYVPTGQDASLNGQTNWERWYSPGATRLLAQFRHTTDTMQQHSIVSKLSQIMLTNFPFIPVFYGAYWYTYSTRNFTGWVTQNNYYAYAPPYQYPDNTKVLTTLTPVK